MSDTALDRLADAQTKIEQLKRWWSEDLARLREIEDAARAVTWYEYTEDDEDVQQAVAKLRDLVGK